MCKLNSKEPRPCPMDKTHLRCDLHPSQSLVNNSLFLVCLNACELIYDLCMQIFCQWLECIEKEMVQCIIFHQMLHIIVLVINNKIITHEAGVNESFRQVSIKQIFCVTINKATYTCLRYKDRVCISSQKLHNAYSMTYRWSEQCKKS